MKRLFICPVCGGHQRINVDTGIAVCDSCGEKTSADPAEIRTLAEIGKNADRFMRQNTAAGYQEAIRLLRTIDFAEGVPEKMADCETRLRALEEKRQVQRAVRDDSEKRDTALGAVLLVLTVLFILAAIAGIVALFILWSRDKLSSTAVTVVVCGIVLVAVLAVISKIKSGN